MVVNFTFSRRLILLALLGAASLLAQVNADKESEYPTTYPFSKEAIKPPAFPDSDPYDIHNGKQAKFNDPSNPGGYLNRFLTCNPYSKDRIAFKYNNKPDQTMKDNRPSSTPGVIECRPTAYLGFTLKKIFNSLNCTGKDVLAPSVYGGVIGGKTVCTDCCKFTTGYIMEPAKKYASLEKELESVYTSGGCPLPSAELLCTWVTVAHQCINFLVDSPSGSQRAVVFPCYDVLWRYLMSCKLFKGNALINDLIKVDNFEPPGYVAKLSPEQNLLLVPVYRTNDRVCHPYSYYYPDEEKPDESNVVSNSCAVLASLASLMVSQFW